MTYCPDCGEELVTYGDPCANCGYVLEHEYHYDTGDDDATADFDQQTTGDEWSHFYQEYGGESG